MSPDTGQSAAKRHADMNSEDPDERYLARLDHGLFPLQLVCVLIAQLHSPMAAELKVCAGCEDCYCVFILHRRRNEFSN